MKVKWFEHGPQNQGVIGSLSAGEAKLLTDRLPRKVKRHFLESELKTADNLIVEYMECGTGDMEHDVSRQKLIWLLERLQEEVL